METLETKIEELNLPIEIESRLKKNGICTLGDIKKAGYRNLHRALRGQNKTIMQEQGEILSAKLEEIGLSMPTTYPQWFVRRELTDLEKEMINIPITDLGISPEVAVMYFTDNQLTAGEVAQRFINYRYGVGVKIHSEHQLVGKLLRLGFKFENDGVRLAPNEEEIQLYRNLPASVLDLEISRLMKIRLLTNGIFNIEQAKDFDFTRLRRVGLKGSQKVHEKIEDLERGL